MTVKVLLFEFLGTFSLVFFTCFSRINNEEDRFTVAMTVFFLVSGLVYIFKPHSGAIFNPFISISLTATKQVSVSALPLHLLGQLAGSAAAALAVFGLNSRGPNNIEYYGLPRLHVESKWEASFLEALSLFILATVHCLFSRNQKAPKNASGAAIGFAYLVSFAATSHMTGGCANFAFVFGPSFLEKYFQDYLFLIISHFTGAALGTAFYTTMLGPSYVAEDNADFGVEPTKRKLLTTQ